jgi:hypothetical protein
MRVRWCLPGGAAAALALLAAGCQAEPQARTPSATPRPAATVPATSTAPATPAPGTLTATGPVGDHRAVTVTVAPTGDPDHPGFAASAVADGKAIALGGPDDPPDLFVSEPRHVLLVPVDATGRNAIVVLYDSSQIGPGHGTDRLALVWRLGPAGATRAADVEAKLEGADSVAQVRSKLGLRR